MIMRRATRIGSALLAGGTLLACASAAVERPAIIRELPLHRPTQQPPLSPSDFVYRGDTIGFGVHSMILPRLSADGQAAILRLANITVFTSSTIGMASTPPEHVKAFRTLLGEPDGAAAFNELAELEQPAARLYGLAGLYLVDTDRFHSLAEPLRDSAAIVRTMRGCFPGEHTVGAIISGSGGLLTHLWDGSWPRELAGLRDRSPSPSS
jgi:hypothetical protein